jgi:hypothetical protein
MLSTNRVRMNAIMRQLPLLRSQPSRLQRIIRQDEGRRDSDNKRNCALENEQPLPPSKTSQVVHPGEDACGYESSESSSENVASIQYRDTCSDFLPCVEDAEHVQRTGIIPVGMSC